MLGVLHRAARRIIVKSSLNHAIDHVYDAVVRHDVHLDDGRATDVQRSVDHARVDVAIQRLSLIHI